MFGLGSGSHAPRDELAHIGWCSFLFFRMFIDCQCPSSIEKRPSDAQRRPRTVLAQRTRSLIALDPARGPAPEVEIVLRSPSPQMRAKLGLMIRDQIARM